ncbi:hypothetical protein EK21DRAFT_93817 [Setomelanomma holmii]|uniref:Uncharacterized protein n=1 Tax=Setomelanomma holmii TaxID=210430 RepID=A0A9P4GZ64_9PLEO|nr:hypothetical protein EK21DRAFT_93817 [Setomelanomma holmii]
MTMSKLTLASLAGAAIVNAAQFGAPMDPGCAQAMAPRDTCAELPALCTGPAMMHGIATTLTYLCPSTTKVKQTVHVTVTETTTVTAGPGESSGAVVPPEDAPAFTFAEPTTTTTIHSTQTQYKTITVSRKKDSSSSDPTPGPNPTPADPNFSVHSSSLRPIRSSESDITTNWLHPITTSYPGSNGTEIIMFSKTAMGTGMDGSAKPTGQRNSTGYAFPTPKQVREAQPSAVSKVLTGGTVEAPTPGMVMLLGTLAAVVANATRAFGDIRGLQYGCTGPSNSYRPFLSESRFHEGLEDET